MNLLGINDIKVEHVYDILVVGCGLSGSVVAERLANFGLKVLIIDKRNHVGGNCYDELDATGIRMSKYGAHLFHTNDEEVWKYIQQFSEWTRWDHRVLGYVDGKYVPIPVNINTVNALCATSIKDEVEMEMWLEKVQCKYAEIRNSEEIACSRVGIELYDKIFKHYTFKQWNKYPDELDSSVLARIPIRNNFDDRYFTDRFQALPVNGYTHFIKRLLSHENIDVVLDADFLDVRNRFNFKNTIYTGPVDHYFNDAGYEKLEYRSIEFIEERYNNTPFFQPNSVINYPGSDVPFTRIVEYKHFLNQKSNHTVIVKEITTDKGEPYYPVPNDKNMTLYAKYKELAVKETSVYFLGRLANYKYFNMDQAIKNALDFSVEFKLTQNI